MSAASGVSAVTDAVAAEIFAEVRCTCTLARKSYALTHASYCARVIAMDSFRAVLEAAEPRLVAAERERLARVMEREADNAYGAADAQARDGLRAPSPGVVARGAAYEHAAELIREAGR